MSGHSINDKEIEDTEFNEVVAEHVNITPRQIQNRFETLKDLSQEQMDTLNKQLVKRLDWRLMPCITLMFLMK